MTTTDIRPERKAAARTTPWLGRRARTIVLIVHVVSASAWIGIDVLVAVLVGTGTFAIEPATRGLAYEALATFVVAPMGVAAVLTGVSGVLLGLGTRWGLIRYWWVAVKLVLNLVMVVLILVLLAPGMPAVRTAGTEIAAGATPSTDLTFLVFPPTVSLSMLTLAVVLAIAKPWGKVRGGRLRRRA